jgi:hypothetical protein
MSQEDYKREQERIALREQYKLKKKKKIQNQNRTTHS